MSSSAQRASGKKAGMRTRLFDVRRRLGLIALTFLVVPGCLWSQPATTIPARPARVLFGKRVSILVGAPRALAQASDSLRLAHALEACPAPIRSGFATAYASEPSAVRGAASDDRVVFVLVPTSSPYWECDAPFSPALLARGVQILPPNATDPGDDIRAMNVGVRGQLVPRDSFARRPLVSFGGIPGQPIDRRSQLTTWISAEYFAPDPAGHLPEVALRVEAADSARSEIVRLAGEALRDVWHDLVVARIEKISDARPVRAPMHLPLPDDKPLREAHALYSSGQLVPAARIAERRLAADNLSHKDARAARMLIIGTLLAYDDTSAARIVMADVLSDAPCLTLSANQAEAERLIDAMRPLARCSTPPLRRLLLASLLPGLGYAVAGNRIGTVVAAGLTGAGAVAAWNAARDGDDAYRRYQAATSTSEATTAYDDATRSRRFARVAIGYAATAWLITGVTAVFMERVHARAIAQVHDYDVHPTVGLEPDIHGGGTRVAMRVSW